MDEGEAKALLVGSMFIETSAKAVILSINFNFPRSLKLACSKLGIQREGSL